MNAKLQQIFHSVSDDPPRSRLDPYGELILRWRRQGRSYRRVKTLLADECSVQVSTTMLFKFVKSRSKPRRAQPEAEPEPVNGPPPPDTGGIGQAGKKYSKLSLEEGTRQRALIQALRDKPVVTFEVQKRFVYDPDEPLSIDQTIKEKHS